MSKRNLLAKRKIIYYLYYTSLTGDNMKALDSSTKDKLIFQSVLEEDLPRFFKTISLYSNTPLSDSGAKDARVCLEFAKRLVFLSGWATSLAQEFEVTQKSFKQEFKEIMTAQRSGSNAQIFYTASIEFFESLSDKLGLVDEKNREYLIFVSLYCYRVYYNYLFLSQPIELEGDLSQQSFVALEVKKSVTEIFDKELFSTSALSTLKLLVNESQEELNQKSFVCLAELAYYLLDTKQIGLDNDQFRDKLTHAMTGCFLLENQSLENIKNLYPPVTIGDMIGFLDAQD